MTLRAKAESQQFQELVEQAGRLADRAGMADLSSRLRTASASAGLPRVVILGEPKRGKSKLVNALIQRPLLSPVGDEVVTATYVVFRPGERDRAVAIVMDAASGAPRRIDISLDQLADYVTVDSAHEGVIGAEVYVDSPLLHRMEMVDTPGVGSVDPRHRAITMSTLESAHAFVFVMDAGAPLSMPEVLFLGEVARRNAGVVLAMTKTDLYPHWEEILDDDRALIARHVPELSGVPIVALSSRMAEDADQLTATGAAEAAELRSYSGIDDLLEALRSTIAARTGALSRAGRLALLKTLLTELRTRLSERPEFLAGDPRRVAVLEEERDRMNSFLLDPHFGALQVNRRLDALRRESEREFSLQVAEVIQRWQAALVDYPAGELKQIPTLLKSELASLVVSSLDRVDHELSDILDGLEDRIGSTRVADGLRERLLHEAELDLSEHEDVGAWGSHLLTAGTRAVAETTFVAISGFFWAGPLGIAIGVATIATAGLKELHDARVSGLQKSVGAWLERVRGEANRAFERELSARLDDIQRIVNSELPRLLQDRVDRIERLTGVERVTADPWTSRALVEVDDLVSHVSSLMTSGPEG